MVEASEDGFNMEDGSTDYFIAGKKGKIDLANMDCKTWRGELQKQIGALQVKMRREKQLNKQVQLNMELKQLRGQLDSLCEKQHRIIHSNWFNKIINHFSFGLYKSANSGFFVDCNITIYNCPDNRVKS